MTAICAPLPTNAPWVSAPVAVTSHAMMVTSAPTIAATPTPVASSSQTLLLVMMAMSVPTATNAARVGALPGHQLFAVTTIHVLQTSVIPLTVANRRSTSMNAAMGMPVPVETSVKTELARQGKL